MKSLPSVRLARAVLCACVLAAARTAAAQSAPPPPITVGRLTIAGFVQADYLGTLEDESDGEPAELVTGFEIARARLGVSGDLGPRVSWTLIGDFARLVDDAVLRDAAIVIRLAPAIAVRVGQYTIPYSLERTTSTTTLEVIDRSVMGTLMTPARDMGLTVFSPKPIRGWLTYSASIINGSGQNQPDDNGAKDVVGRVTVHVPRVKGLRVGINGATGEQPVGDRHRGGVDVNYEFGS